MAEIQSTPNHFTTITYVTKDGEKCTATKNNGIVTVQGDKNGVRQVPEEQFMKELVATLPQVDLARTPNKDTVQFKGGEEKTIDNQEAKPNHKVRNWAIGIGTSAAAIVGFVFAGLKGHLGQGIQKFLGGMEKDVGKLTDSLPNRMELPENEYHSADEIIRKARENTDEVVREARQKAEETLRRTGLIDDEKGVLFDKGMDIVADSSAKNTLHTAGAKAEEVAATPANRVNIKEEELDQIRREFRQSEEVAATPAPKPNETATAKKEEIARRKQIDEDLARQQEEAQKEADRLRREQEEMTNNDIINAAVLADMMSGAGKKTAEKAAETASKTTDKMVEQLAKEIDKAAETTAKADVPKAGTVVEEVLPSAGRAEASTTESLFTNGEKAADDWAGITENKGDGLFAQTEKHADDFAAETPKTSYFDDTVDEFGLPKIESYEDDLLSSYDSGLNHLDDSLGYEADVSGFSDDIGESFSSFDDGFDFM